MKRRAAFAIVLSFTACSVGGTTVNLGDGQWQSVAGGGDSTAAGGAGLSLGDAGVGGLMIDPGSYEPLCADGEITSISGTVWDPAAKVPLYNAVVYVPKEGEPLPDLPQTVACEKCADSLPARAVTLSGPDGKFQLLGTPAGKVDLVVQLGKWRRKQTVTVQKCQDNPLRDPNDTRLPKTRSEGSIPKIAVSTGHSDALECLLRKIGIDDSEFSTDADPGRVNLFVGCEEDNEEADGSKHTGASHFDADHGGGSFPSTNQLFDAGKLAEYDVLVFSCEGHKCDSIQTPDHIAQLVDFANRGGRVFLDHEHYNWLSHADAPIESAADFDHKDSDTIANPLTTEIDRDFPKGRAFAEWLVDVGASTKLGALDIYTAKTSVSSLSPNRAQSWIYRDDDPTGFFYFTIGTPVAEKDDDPAPPACGRVVFTDLHLSKSGGGDPTASDFSDQDTPFPDGCTTTELSAQEKALEFMFFDLTSCVQQDDATPTPPVVK